MVGNRIFTDEYGVLVDLLVGARRAAGVSQRTLATRIGRSPSHVARIEQRQRRVETVEFYLIAKALGLDPAVLFGTLRDQLDQIAPA